MEKLIKLKRKSKTLRFHTGMLIVLAGLAVFATLFQAEISPVTYAILMAVDALGGIILRFFTVEPIK